jgi:hypothetical protein
VDLVTMGFEFEWSTAGSGSVWTHYPTATDFERLLSEPDYQKVTFSPN